MKIQVNINATRVSRAFKVAPHIMIDRVDQYVHRAALELARLARQKAAKGATSTLTNSIKADKLAKMDYLVGPHVQHGVYVELGTKGGHTPPPHQPILDWVRSPGGLGLSGDQAERTAWAVSRKIARTGTPAQPFMKPAQEEMGDRVQMLVTEGIREGLRRAGLGG